MNRGFQDGAFQVAFSGITRPSHRLPAKATIIPCPAFNQGRCNSSDGTCKLRHVCQRCRQSGHSQVSGRCTVVPPDVDSGSILNSSLLRVGSDEIHGECPAAESTLTAAPLPRPPPLYEFSAVLRDTMKRHAQLFRIVTPINADAFEQLLSSHPNREYVDSVVVALKEGFWPWARNITGYPTTNNESHCRSQKPRSMDKVEFLQKQLQEELDARRYSQSMGRRLLPGLYCMPLAVSRSSGKLRVINDHSAGIFSLNSRIPEQETSVKNDDIMNLAYVLRKAKSRAKGKEIILFKSDVRHAYRLMPMHPLWQAMQAVRINGEYYIDRCNCFGGSASGRVFYAFYSLVLWIASEVKGIRGVLAHVDDNFSWEYASRTKLYKPYGKVLPEKQAKLLELWDEIGIPHSEKKQENGSVLTIVGHEVDMLCMRISLPSEQKEKVELELARLCEDSAKREWSRHDLQKAVGVINWAIQFNPLLKPGIHSLLRALKPEVHEHDAHVGLSPSPSPGRSSSLNTQKKILLTSDILKELKWLRYHLGNARGVTFASTSKDAPPVSMKIIVSSNPTTTEFRFWLLDTRDAYRSHLDMEGDLTQDLRAVFAVLCAIPLARHKHPNVHRLVVFTDSAIAAEMLKSFKAGDDNGGSCNELLMSTADMLLKCKIVLEIHFLPSSEQNGPIIQPGVGILSSDLRYYKMHHFEIPQLLKDVAISIRHNPNKMSGQ